MIINGKIFTEDKKATEKNIERYNITTISDGYELIYLVKLKQEKLTYDEMMDRIMNPLPILEPMEYELFPVFRKIQKKSKDNIEKDKKSQNTK